MNTRIFINCINFKLHDETLAIITAKSEKLFQRGTFLSYVRLALEGDYSRNSNVEYKVSLVLQLRTSEIIVSRQSEILMTAVELVLTEARRELDFRVAPTPERREMPVNPR